MVRKRGPTGSTKPRTGRPKLKTKGPVGETDSVWKETLDRFFPAFLEFFFPENYVEIDWSKGYEFLDKELEKLVADSEIGRRLADKLVKVYLKGTGEQMLLLIHVEVQGYPDPRFEYRMRQYNYRIHDRYGIEVVSLAVLTDDQQSFRPSRYQFSQGKFNNLFEFPAVKLLDYNDQWQELEQSRNVFSLVVMAHLKAQQERKNLESLVDWKVKLVELLLERNYQEETVWQLLRFIDWLIRLPQELEQVARERIEQLGKREIMAYVTSWERLAEAKGKEEGRKDGIAELVLTLLSQRLDNLSSELAEQITALNAEQLKALGTALLSFNSSAELEAWLRAQQN